MVGGTEGSEPASTSFSKALFVASKLFFRTLTSFWCSVTSLSFSSVIFCWGHSLATACALVASHAVLYLPTVALTDVLKLAMACEMSPVPNARLECAVCCADMLELRFCDTAAEASADSPFMLSPTAFAMVLTAIPDSAALPALACCSVEISAYLSSLRSVQLSPMIRSDSGRVDFSITVLLLVLRTRLH
jgi:hypothetical protein